MTEPNFDIAIIGGGINGAVSAAALSAAGLRVLLVEKNDFASQTSQESSNMVWGGIKYLQTFEIPLVFKLCRSRSRLFSAFPTRIRQIGFFAVGDQNAPASPLITYAGALLYWFIGLFGTKAPKFFGTKKAKEYESLVHESRISGAVQYFDGLLNDNDARFVWDFVNRANQLGADTRNYTEMTSASRSLEGWRIELKNSLNNTTESITAKVLINAAGPESADLNNKISVTTKNSLALSKGIHLIVPKITADDRVIAVWDEEGRLFYVLPMHDRSVIGTTDTRVASVTKEVTEADRDFVLRNINQALKLEKPLTKADIIAERSGVRPLVISSPKKGAKSQEIDWHKLSRKHVIEVDVDSKALTIFGGKLTDCLNIGEEVLNAVQRLGLRAGKPAAWFGEDSSVNAAEKLVELLAAVVSNGDQQQLMAEGLWRRHGLKSFEIAARLQKQPLLAEPVFEGLGFSYGELEYIIENEQVKTAEDLLRRRTPIALVRSAAEIAANEKLQKLVNERVGA